MQQLKLLDMQAQKATKIFNTPNVQQNDIHLIYDNVCVYSTLCLKKCFCENFIKFSPALITFGTKIDKMLKLCEVHSFSSSANSHQCNTCWRKCYKLLHNAELLSAVNFLTMQLAHNKVECALFTRIKSSYNSSVQNCQDLWSNYAPCTVHRLKLFFDNGGQADHCRVPTTQSWDPVWSTFANKQSKPYHCPVFDFKQITWCPLSNWWCKCEQSNTNNYSIM